MSVDVLPIDGLAHISVFTTDVEVSVRFYTEKLEFKLVYRTTVDPGGSSDGFFPVEYALVQHGSCVVELVEPSHQDKVRLSTRGTVDHFALRVRDIDRVFATLQRRGVQFESAEIGSLPTLFSNFRSVNLVGPSGEVIEICEYTMEAFADG